MAGFFIIASVWFWHALAAVYRTPYAWTSFNNDFNYSLIPLAAAIIVMIVFSSLLTVFKANTLLSKIVYGTGAAAHLVFLPFGIVNIGAGVLFYIGFVAYERYTGEMLHNCVKIHFFDTYWRTVPSLITYFTFVIAIGSFQASIDNLNSLKITIPKGVIEQTVNLVTGGSVKGESTFIAQNPPSSTDMEALDEIVNEQLSRFGITDPRQKAFIKQQVYQQAGLQMPVTAPSPTIFPNTTPGSPVPSGFAPTGTLPSFPVFSQSNALAGQLQQEYKEILVQQSKAMIERQLEGIIERNRMYIPILNAIAIFFLVSIINIPVMLVSVGTVTLVMSLMKSSGMISVVRIQAEVERLTW